MGPSTPPASQLPVKLAGDYATNTDLQEDAVGLIDRVLDALTNTTTLFAALDPEGTGIFDHFDYDATTEGVRKEGNYIQYDNSPDQRRWETIGNNRPLSAFLGEREYKVIASLGMTDYTRFGAWYHIGAASAERQPGPAVRKNQGRARRIRLQPAGSDDGGQPVEPGLPARRVGDLRRRDGRGHGRGDAHRNCQGGCPLGRSG